MPDQYGRKNLDDFLNETLRQWFNPAPTSSMLEQPGQYTSRSPFQGYYVGPGNPPSKPVIPGIIPMAPPGRGFGNAPAELAPTDDPMSGPLSMATMAVGPFPEYAPTGDPVAMAQLERSRQLYGGGRGVGRGTGALLPPDVLAAAAKRQRDNAPFLHPVDDPNLAPLSDPTAPRIRVKRLPQGMSEEQFRRATPIEREIEILNLAQANAAAARPALGLGRGILEGGGKQPGNRASDTAKMKALNEAAKKQLKNEPQLRMDDFTETLNAASRHFEAKARARGEAPETANLFDKLGITPGKPLTPAHVGKIRQLANEYRGMINAGDNSPETKETAAHLDILEERGIKAASFPTHADIKSLGRKEEIKSGQDRLVDKILVRGQTPGAGVKDLENAVRHPVTGLKYSHLLKLDEQLGQNADPTVRAMVTGLITQKQNEQEAAKQIRIRKDENAQELLTAKALARSAGIVNPSISIRQAQQAEMKGDMATGAELRKKAAEGINEQLKRLGQIQGGRGGIDQLDMAKFNLQVAELAQQGNAQKAQADAQSGALALQKQKEKDEQDQIFGQNLTIQQKVYEKFPPMLAARVADVAARVATGKKVDKGNQEIADIFNTPSFKQGVEDAAANNDIRYLTDNYDNIKWLLKLPNQEFNMLLDSSPSFRQKIDKISNAGYITAKGLNEAAIWGGVTTLNPLLGFINDPISKEFRQWIKDLDVLRNRTGLQPHQWK